MSEAYGHIWGSVPRYDKLRFDASGKRHVFVAEGSGAEAMLRKWPIAMASKYEKAGKPGQSFEFHYNPSVTATGQDLSSGLKETLGAERVSIYPSREAMLSFLEEEFASAANGLRLYVSGPEVFLWTVAKFAREFGMGDEEVHVELIGDASRRVYCAHCKTITEGVTRDEGEPCSGCGEPLEVLPHFSRRWIAYLGYKADAEDPGNVPEPTESYV